MESGKKYCELQIFFRISYVIYNQYFTVFVRQILLKNMKKL
jgi:hypothetical protein